MIVTGPIEPERRIERKTINTDSRVAWHRNHHIAMVGALPWIKNSDLQAVPYVVLVYTSSSLWYISIEMVGVGIVEKLDRVYPKSVDFLVWHRTNALSLIFKLWVRCAQKIMNCPLLSKVQEWLPYDAHFTKVPWVLILENRVDWRRSFRIKK